MRAKYRSVTEWLAECRATVRRDLDNVILFSGPEGVGKSTIMYQVMSALDPTFDQTRVHFTVEDFIASAPQVPRYCAVVMDEALVNRRKSMTSTNIALLDYVQVCRGLNHHLGLCFPHEQMLDRAIADFRVRFNVHVPRRGMFVLRTRSHRDHRLRTGETRMISTWQELGRWNFKPNTGPRWDAYLQAKQQHMESVGEMHAIKAAEKREKSARKKGWVDPDSEKRGLAILEDLDRRQREEDQRTRAGIRERG